MLLLAGLLAIVQLTFLPGYLTLRGLRLRHGPLATWVLSFALSLLINHLLVLGLVLAGWYRAPVLYGVMAAELGVLLWSTRRACAAPLQALWPSQPARPWKLPESWPFAAEQIAVVLAWGLVAGYACKEIGRLGSIFTAWDAVAAWNRWAVEWSQGGLPHGTHLYPQLLPTSWSFTYVWIHDPSLWFFAKGMLFLFPLLLLVALLDLYHRTRDFRYVLGVGLTYQLLGTWVQFSAMTCGYADAPVAFFAFMPTYALLLARHEADPRAKRRLVLLGAALAAGAALTKQVALWIVGVYPLLCWVLVLAPLGTPGMRRRWRDEMGTVVRACLLLAVLTVPWYAFKLAQFHAGGDISNVALLATDPALHAHRSLGERLLHGLALATQGMPLYLAIGAAALILAALRDRVQRWFVALVVLPYFAIWALAFSYDTRNLAMLAPYAGLAAATGLTPVLAWLVREQTWKASHRGRLQSVLHGAVNRLRSQPAICSVALVAVVVVGICLCVKDERLLARQQRLQREVGMPNVNGMLYEYADRHPFDADLVSNYWFVPWLPGVREHYRPHSTNDFLRLDDRQWTQTQFDGFRREYERPQTGFAFFCMQYANPQIRAYLDAAVRAGTARIALERDFGWFGACRIYEKLPRDRVVRQVRDAVTR